MKRLTIFLIIIFVFNNFISAQSVNCFIDYYKEAYDSKIKTLCLDMSITYLPVIWNLSEEKNHNSWIDLSPVERRKNLWNYLCPPILANDEAINLQTGKVFLFPEGFLYHDRDSIAATRMIETPLRYPAIIALIHYLNDHHPDYIFKIANLGDGSVNGMYWIIQDNDLFILLYDNDSNKLVPVDAETYLNGTDGMHYLCPLGECY